MEPDYKFRYVNDYITNLLDGNMTLQYEDVDLKGVKKRLKEKSFAANVSRDDINDAYNRAGIALDDLIAFIIPIQAAVI